MSQHARRQLTVVLAGAASLAIAMGVGRFAFTPILPMMLHDGVLDLQVAGNLATANYIGYLVGALASMLVPKKWDHTTVIRLALVTTVILTALMALPVPSMWISLRFLAGVVSAVGFVFTSGWCLAELSGTSGSIGSAIYTGPGAGIALSGVAASFMSAAGLTGQLGWVTFAAMSAIMSALIWGVFGRRTKLVEPFYVGTARAASGKVLGAEMPLFAMAYGLAGFGYIITATYLPVIAKNAIPDSPLLTVFWPLFGISAVVGSLLAAKVKKSADARLYLIALPAAGCRRGSVGCLAGRSWARREQHAGRNSLHGYKLLCDERGQEDSVDSSRPAHGLADGYVCDWSDHGAAGSWRYSEARGQRGRGFRSGAWYRQHCPRCRCSDIRGYDRGVSSGATASRDREARIWLLDLATVS